ncbi:MAG: TetR/AcrR family transcriptional regulator [Cyanobacteria bacterium J06638_22]
MNSVPLQHLSGEKADKAKAILEGALQVFTADGYAAASMGRIATAAGVSKPTLYSYFQDKEGLFVALVQHLTYTIRQNILNLPLELDPQVSPEQILRQMAMSNLKAFSQNSSLLTLMRLMIGESERFPDLSRTFVRELIKPMLERFSTFLAAYPCFSPSDPLVAARIFSGAIVHYLIVQYILHGEDVMPLEHERMVDGLIETMISPS